MTILTPTYNRAYILKNAFDSLLRQTSLDFEWVVVDDGSTDDTESLVQSFLESEPPFRIRYFKQENGGKHRAVNKGVAEASYDYVLILDSDDYLTDDAVEKIHGWIETIAGKEEFAGVAGLRGWISKDGPIGGGGNGGEYTDATNIERKRYHLMGDKAEVYRTEILKKYPFPEFEGENFLSEHVVWDTIAKDGYKIRWFHEIVYKCEYLEDGLTKGGSYKRQQENFGGFTLSMRLKAELAPFPQNLFAVGLYAHVAKLNGMRAGEARKRLGVGGGRMLLGRTVFSLNEMRKKLKKR